MLNIILFGPPNCGKGTQAERICKTYGLIHLSTGDLLRAEREAGTPLGLAAQAIMDRGDLVSDEIILGMIGNQLENRKDAAGFLFDGFPRTVAQKEGLAALLQEKGSPLACVVSMLVPEEELRARMRKRALEQGRADDTDVVFERRMDNYKQQTMPLADLYRADGLLREISGVGAVDEITARIESILQAYTPVN